MHVKEFQRIFQKTHLEGQTNETDKKKFLNVEKFSFLLFGYLTAFVDAAVMKKNSKNRRFSSIFKNRFSFLFSLNKQILIFFFVVTFILKNK